MDEERKYSKMYWWIKLMDGFFDTKEMRKLRRIAGGAVYQLIYLKMQLIAMKNCGRIYFDGIEDTFADEIALTLDETPEDVQATLVLLERMGLVKKMSEDTIYLPEAEANTGSETKWAAKKRNYRKAVAASKAKAISDNKKAKEDNVLDVSSTCPTEIESEIEIESEYSLREYNAHARGSVYGVYKNVLLTDDALEALRMDFPTEWQRMIDNLSTYMQTHGTEYADHAAVMRKWAAEDAKKKKAKPGSGANAFGYETQREYSSEEMDELELKMRLRRTGDQEGGGND